MRTVVVFLFLASVAHADVARFIVFDNGSGTIENSYTGNIDFSASGEVWGGLLRNMDKPNVTNCNREYSDDSFFDAKNLDFKLTTDMYWSNFGQYDCVSPQYAYQVTVTPDQITETFPDGTVKVRTGTLDLSQYDYEKRPGYPPVTKYDIDTTRRSGSPVTRFGAASSFLGQTFTVPDNVNGIQSVEVFVSAEPHRQNPEWDGTTEFSVVVSPFSGNRAGENIFQSDPIPLEWSGEPVDLPDLVRVNFRNTPVVPGEKYVLSLVPSYDELFVMNLGFTGGSYEYDDGSLAVGIGSPEPDDLTDVWWNNTGPGTDLSFRMSFTSGGKGKFKAVPEPSSAAIIALGLLGCVVQLRNAALRRNA